MDPGQFLGLGRRARGIARGSPWLMSQFWQNTQPRLQPEKNMVPEPPAPTSTASSPKWSWYEAITACRPVRQKPVSPDSRSTRHCRGQRSQPASRDRASSARAASSPEAGRAR
jgi:hypothetical protein